MWERDPTKILWSAVRGMLPKNKLRVYRLDKLKIFPESQHPFGELDLVPYVPPPRKLNNPALGWALPQGLAPVNPAKYAFRLLNAQFIKEQGRPAVDFGDLLTEEERQALKLQALSGCSAPSAPPPSSSGKGLSKQ